MRPSHQTTKVRRSSKRRWNAPPKIASFLAVFSNALQVLGTQLGIGVMKAQQRPARFGCSGIHLSAARGLVAGNQADDSLTVQLEKACPRLNRRHHPLGKLWGDWQTAHEINDEFVIIPDGNDQADQRTHCVAVIRRKPRPHLCRTWCMVRHASSLPDNAPCANNQNAIRRGHNGLKREQGRTFSLKDHLQPKVGIRESLSRISG